MPEFAHRDPLSPQFWDERFERGFTPWERGGVPEALRRFVSAAPQPLRTLIPGCGSARELVYLLEAGWDATAIDFSPAAVSRAQAQAGKWRCHIVEADFFRYQLPAPLDLIYEQAFLCAMPRATWPAVAARWAALLPTGGLLAGFFYFDDHPKGPPFGIARDALDQLLSPHFDCIVDDAVADSIPIFAGKERWLVWQRRRGTA
jgi:SAM-dependent methyltransferase